jgi:hypothetical protein
MPILAPELPYSIIPLSIRERFGIQPASPPPGWQNRPAPRWRGVPCQVGSAPIWMLNELAPGEPVEFKVLALFPESEPTGPRVRQTALGQQFLLQYGFRVTIEHSAIRFDTDPGTGRRELTPSPGCGCLELV